jgi:pantetheine-phosphate adenylyltransferase
VRIAVYPGSFDPLTYGHLDVIGRAAALFDRVIVGVLENPRKQYLLASVERVRVIEATVAADRALTDAVEVRAFDGLTVEFARRNDARFLVRGLRAIGDFDIELQLAHNNRQLAPELDTVCLMTSLEHAYISSSLAKEIARFDGDVSAMLPPAAADAVRAALRRG